MERSQNWPDLTVPISKFRDIHFIDTVNHTRGQFQGNRSIGVAMASIQSFSEVRSLESLTLPSDLTLDDLGDWV